MAEEQLGPIFGNSDGIVPCAGFFSSTCKRVIEMHTLPHGFKGIKFFLCQILDPSKSGKDLQKPCGMAES